MRAILVLILIALLVLGTLASGQTDLDYLKWGIDSLKLGHNDSAYFNLWYATNLNNRNSIAWFYLGVASFNLGKKDEAFNSFNNATKWDSNNDTIWFITAPYFEKLNEPDYALNAYENVIKLNKSHVADSLIRRGEILKSRNGKEAEANYSLGYGYSLKGDNNKALAYLKKAIQSDEYYAEAWIRKGEILRGINGSEAEGYYSVGYGYSLKRDNDKALAYLNESIQLNKSYAEAWIRKGEILRGINGGEAEGYYSIGYGYSLKRDNDTALAYLNESILLNKSYAEARIRKGEILRGINGGEAEGYYSIGYGYSLKRDNDTALAYLNESILLNKSYAEAWIRKGEILQGTNGSEAEAYYALGHGYYLKGDNNKAIEYLNTSLNKSQTYADAWNNKGLAFFRLNKIDEALDAFANATNYISSMRDSPMEDPWYYKGLMLYKKNDDQSAIYAFDEAIKINKSNLSAWYYRSVALRRLGRNDEALSSFNHLLQVKNKVPGEKDQDWIWKGERLGNKGWHKAALKALSNIAANKTNRRASYNRGLAYYNLRMYKEALNEFDNATRDYSIYNKDDKDIIERAFNNKAVALSNSYRDYEALESVQKALEMDNSSIEAWYTKGLILTKLNRSEEAIQAFNKALEIDPLNQKALDGKGHALALMGKYKEALDCYSNSASYSWDYEQAWIDRGNAYKRLNQDAKSLETFDSAMNIIGLKEAALWCDIGYASKLLNKTQDALDAFNKSIDRFNEYIIIDPYCAGAWYNKSIILADQNRSIEAQNCLEKALEIKPAYNDTAEFWYVRGKILKNLNKTDEALISFDKSIRLNELYLKPRIEEINIYNALGQNDKVDKYQIQLTALGNSIKDQTGITRDIPDAGGDIPDAEDLGLLKKKLDAINEINASLWEGKADAQYELRFIDKGISSYIEARRLSPVSDQESIMSKAITAFYFILIAIIALGIIISSGILKNIPTHQIEIIRNSRLFPKISLSAIPPTKFIGIDKALNGFMRALNRFSGFLINIKSFFINDRPTVVLIFANVFSFTAFTLILSEFFDISRAFWSLFVIVIILLVAASVLGLYGYLKPIWWIRVELTFLDLGWNNIWIFNIILGSCIFSSFICLSPLFISSDLVPDSILDSVGGVRGTMTIILISNMLATILLMASLLLSRTLNREMRKIIAAGQFIYISVSAVPLSWVLWSFGYPSGASNRFFIEDMSFNIPVSTIILFFIFLITFILPYTIGYFRHKAWILDLRKRQMNWLNRALKFTSEPNEQKRIEGLKGIINKIDNQLICDLKTIFPYEPDHASAEKGFAEFNEKQTEKICDQDSVQPIGVLECEDLYEEINRKLELCCSNSKEKNVDIVAELYAKKLSVLGEPMLSRLNISLTIHNSIKSYMERLSQATDSDSTSPNLENIYAFMTSSDYTKNIYTWGSKKSTELSNYYAKNYRDLIGALEKWITSEETSQPQVWIGFITVFLMPILTLALSILAPWIGIPLDQGGLVKIISEAASQYTFGL